MTVIIDAKLIPVLRREIFADMNRHGLTAASVVCSIWEDPAASSKQLESLTQFVEENDDLLLLVRSHEDLDIAAESGRTGVIASWQNSTGFGRDLESVERFAARGLRIAQPTFIAANAAGYGCNAPSDAGLTDFGRALVGAMNRVGIAIDMAHLGPRTSQDTLEASALPVFYSQCSPRALNDAARNKSDDEMRAVADRGGVISLTTLRQYLPRALDATVDDMAATITHALAVVGDDAVALGSDLTPGQGPAFFDYICHDGGDGPRVMEYGELPTLPGFEGFEGYGNLERALRSKGVRASTIEKVMGGNLRRFFATVWTAAEGASSRSME